MRTEEIYEALFDEEAFQLLPGRFAALVNAKSAIINWVHQEGEAVNLAYHNYSAELMAQYAAHYVQKDPWVVAAMRPTNHNRIFNASESVPDTAFERSEFYNELIRANGEDTFYCVGGAFVSEHGIGILGINRARTQNPFDERAKRLLESRAVALRRVLLMRGEIAAHRRDAVLARNALDIVGLAAIVVSGDLRVLHINEQAEAVLARADGLRLKDGLLAATSRHLGPLLATAAAKATCSQERATATLVVARDGAEPYRVTVSPMPGGGRARALLLFRDPDLRQPGLSARVAQLFHLTGAESELAVALSEGLSVGEIAQRRCVQESTIRTQVKALAAKLECSRQSEIAAIVAKIPPLRGRR